VQAIQSVNSGDKTFATVFHVGYADGLGGPNTTISVYDQWGHLVFSGRDSNVADQGPTPTQSPDTSNLGHTSFGSQDPYIGSVQMPAGFTGANFPGANATYPLPAGTYPPPPQGPNGYDGPNGFTYFVAISSNATLPVAMDATFNAGSSNPLVRLEPVDGYQRIVEDHIGFTGYTSGDATAQLGSGSDIKPQDGPLLPVNTVTDLQQNVRPFTLNDVVLFVSTSESKLYTADPANGVGETLVGPLAGPGSDGQTQDIAIRTDGNLYAYNNDTTTDPDAGDVWQVDPGTAAMSQLPGATEGDNAMSPPYPVIKSVDAMAFVRFDAGKYDSYLSAKHRGAPYSDLLRSNNHGTDLVDTASGYGADLGTMFTGSLGGVVAGGRFSGAVANGFLDNGPSPGTPGTTTTFTITDLANRTLTFNLVEEAPNQSLVSTFSGVTETIFYHYADLSPTIAQVVVNGINQAFTAYAAANPPPPGTVEPNAVVNTIFMSSPPLDFVTVNFTLSTTLNTTPFAGSGAGPGGFITGMAWDLGLGKMVEVSSNGGVFTSAQDSSRLTYLPGSAIFTQLGYHFTGLTLGPQNLDWNGDGIGGDLKDVLFASYTGPDGLSYVTAITPQSLGANNIFGLTAVSAGSPLPVFDAF